MGEFVFLFSVGLGFSFLILLLLRYFPSCICLLVFLGGLAFLSYSALFLFGLVSGLERRDFALWLVDNLLGITDLSWWRRFVIAWTRSVDIRYLAFGIYDFSPRGDVRSRGSVAWLPPPPRVI